MTDGPMWARVWVPYLAYFGGAAFGVLWPYVRKYLESGERFSLRAVAGKVAVALLGLFLLPSLGEVVAQLGGLSWVVAFGMGLAATTVGHEAQKTPAALRAAGEER